MCFLVQPGICHLDMLLQLALSAKFRTACEQCCINFAQKLRYLEWWRLCFFLSTLAPICWATSLAVKLLVTAVESQLSIAKNALYFMAAVKVALPCTVTRLLLSC